MAIYYIIFFAAVLIYYINGEREGKVSRMGQVWMLALMLAFLAVFVGLSDMLGGYDRYIYAELSDDAADVVEAHQPLMTAQIFTRYPKEWGYGWYNILMGCITPNRYIFILITTIIIYCLLFQSIKKYCNNYPFAVILFLGLWFFFTFTYLRQCLGATICWLGIQYVAKRDLKRFLLVCFIAFTFHNSAIIFLPFYFIPVRKYSRQTVLIIMVAMLVLGFTGVPGALFDAYGEVDEGRAETVGNETGFRIAYILEAAFFLYFILSKYNEIPDKKLNIVLLNMTLVFCAILLFFIRNENGGRLSWYYMMGVIATVTYISTNVSTPKIDSVILIVLFFFLFNRIVSSWGLQLYPYKTFLTEGVREGDIIWQNYEYDHIYDNNKLYRPVFKLTNPF